MSFKGKCLIVTGAATGIGRAAAGHLMQAGARVALWDHDVTTIRALADASQNRAVAIPVDVSSATQVGNAFRQTLELLGACHGAFNNAGIGRPTVPLESIEEEDFDDVLRVNLKGVWLCMREQIRHLKANGGGSIVNNASVAGLVALPMQAAYGAAKHGVVGLTKVAAVEGAESGVRVNAVCPGAVRTPILRHLEAAGISEDVLASMSPQNRIAEPAEIAQAVAWLLSDASSFITGAAVPVDGGWTAR